MCTRPVLMSITLSLLVGAAAAADGLVPPDGTVLWPQWQARVNPAGNTLASLSLIGPANGQASAQQLGAVLGDYYFKLPGLQLPSAMGGLRATSGMLSGSGGLKVRSTATFLPVAGADTASAVAYLGLGYTGQGSKGGWGVTADLGVAAESAATQQLGRALFGTQGLDIATRELRLSPVLQLGVRLAF